MPGHPTTSNRAHSRMLAASVQRGAADPAIRPAVLAASALLANRQKQAITQRDQEVGFREDLDSFSRREKEGSSASAAVAPHIRGRFVPEPVQQSLLTGIADIASEFSLPLKRGLGEVVVPGQR